MSKVLAPALVLSLFATTELVRAAPFQNLDFEQATIVPAGAGFYEPLDSAAALPHWTVTLDNTVQDTVFGQANILDELSVALVYSGNLYPTSPITPPIQGNYDVQLYAIKSILPDPPHSSTVSISQVGDVPDSAESIRFLIRNPPGYYNVLSVPLVLLDGVPISLVTLSSSYGIISMAGDVSAFAGATADLVFEAQPQPDIPGDVPGEDIYELDDISFSSSPVPEPVSLALFAAGAAPLLIRRRRIA